ncbi:hypothetical protein LSAT2_031373 [Lamellibrachia satsuma]|nr:hypothetical protein LSAT2_031373 [Lamellibrachia satsuma]
MLRYKRGYHGNGTYCILIDICQENNGGCHQNASCLATAPGEANCTCGTGLGGDGISCYGSVAYEVFNHPTLSLLQILVKRVPQMDDYLADLSSEYTLLAPADTAMRSFMQGTSSKFWQQQDNLLLMLGYHTVDGAVTVDDMKTKFVGSRLMVMADDGAVTSVNVTLMDGVVHLNDAKILHADLPALNGYIHIIDTVLEPYPVSTERPTLEVLLSQHIEFKMFAKYLKARGMIEKIEALNSSYTLFVPVNHSMGTADSTSMWQFLSYYVVHGEYTVEEQQHEVLLPTLLGVNTSLYFTRDTENAVRQQTL